ncbi:MAG: membrane protein insertase YidC [Gammaproteobacteria bacterium]|nr:membrane protein insertase YidC [Gammaproteobacteria bacterium]
MPTAPRLASHEISTSAASVELVHVRTNVMTLAIDPHTGYVVESSLLAYPKAQDKQEEPLNLFSMDKKYFYQEQSGFLNDAGQKEALYFTTNQRDLVLEKDQQSLALTLVSNPSASGIIFEKKYTFHPNSYVIDLSYSIKNTGSSIWKGYYYNQLVRSDEVPNADDGTSRYTYFGAATSTPEEHYNKVSFSAMKKDPVDLQKITGGWVAMLQHYFVSALVPDHSESVNFYSNVDHHNNLYFIGVLSPVVSVAPGELHQSSGMQLYSGPAIAKNLDHVSPHLNLTIDYGWLWFISVIIFWLMQHIYDIVGNWGWSIVLVTVVIKLVFYQLSAKSYRSMASMKRLQPHIKVLQERFSSDRQQLSKAMMELYKKEKVNPLGGCLPLLIQIPVFIALYWVIVESVQLRQAPFIFWICDLAVKDPYYILPIIMGVTMFVQQKISPPPPDPVQAKVMMFLPVVFTIFFLQFPAGLVLYWIVNNTLSIAQQWYMMQKYGEKKTVK